MHLYSFRDNNHIFPESATKGNEMVASGKKQGIFLNEKIIIPVNFFEIVIQISNNTNIEIFQP